MTLQALNDQLLELRLSTFRNALREQQANPKYNDLTFEDRLSLLVDAECTQRRENRIKRNIRSANFPMQASLEDLDFSPARGLDRRLILELGQSGWIASRNNILVLGPTGSGKSYLASAFGVAAARNGYTVRYHRISRLLHTLAIARRTMGVVKMNLVFTAVYNVMGLALAAFGFLPPILAAAAQSLPDLGILANSARLLRQR